MSATPGLILANRAYIDHDRPVAEGEAAQPGAGGLLAALHSIIEPWDDGSGTTWVGASRGAFDREWTDERGYELIDTPRGALRHRRLAFDAATWSGHYDAVSNSFFWPLLHLSHQPLPDLTGYFPAPVSPSAREWRAYRAVNAAFADAAFEERAEGGCWIHDYHLALVPSLLRGRRFSSPIGFFLHTPVPDLGIANQYLDAAGRVYLREWLEGCLGADLVGFQTADNLDRFTIAAATLCGFSIVADGLQRGTRTVRTGVFPVGIDALEIDGVPEGPLPAHYLPAVDSGLPLVVGLERSDYTKGIPERFRALEVAYQSGTRFAYLGVAAPTREGTPAYQSLDRAITSAAGVVANAAEAAGLPFLHVPERTGWETVIGLLRRADIVLTTSLADGMNLVPLQAVVAQSKQPRQRRGVVFTGERAGVASLAAAHDGFIAVDPFEPESVASCLASAVAGRTPRISDSLTRRVRKRDVHDWADAFLESLAEMPDPGW